jgi:hypothetical protein
MRGCLFGFGSVGGHRRSILAGCFVLMVSSW